MMYHDRNLDPETVRLVAQAAMRINAIPDEGVRMKYILRILVENAQLMVELNAHRQERGLEPLTIRIRPL